MRNTTHFLLVLLGLATCVTARSIENKYGSVEELLSLDLGISLEPFSFDEIFSSFDDKFELDSPLPEDVLIDLLNQLRNPNLGSILKSPKLDRAFELHSNATGTVRYPNVTGNFTGKGYRDFHMNLDNHTGHYHGVMYREGKVDNDTEHRVLFISEGRIVGKGYSTEIMERAWTHVFVKNKDNTVTQIANTTQGGFTQINSTSDGQFAYEALLMGHNNMSNHFIAWGDIRTGSIKIGADSVNWTATGQGSMKAINSTTDLDPSVLVNLLMGTKMLKMATLKDSGAVANFTDSSAGTMKVGQGPMPYNNSFNETIVVPSKNTYNSSEIVNGSLWQTPAAATTASDGVYALHLMDIISLFM